MNSRGYTLVELIIYSLVALIVIGFSLSLIRTTSRSYTRDRRKSRMQTEGRNAILMMSREIVNTGFKKYLKFDPGVDTTLITVSNTTTGDLAAPVPAQPVPGDGESSFMYYPGIPGDTLEIFRATLKANGQFDTTQRITYSRSGNTLERKLREHDGTNWIAEPTTELANNVEALQFQFSTDKTTWTNSITGIKKDIKAIKIFLLIRTNKEVDLKVQKTYHLGNTTIVPTGDRHLRRLYIEIVEVVNNGT